MLDRHDIRTCVRRRSSIFLLFTETIHSTIRKQRERAVLTSEIPFLCWRRYRTVQDNRRGFLRWRKRDSDFPFWKRKILLSPRTYSLPYKFRNHQYVNHVQLFANIWNQMSLPRMGSILPGWRSVGRPACPGARGEGIEFVQKRTLPG